jgi:hypothetical protein
MKYEAIVFITSGRNMKNTNIESFVEIIGLSNSCLLLLEIFLNPSYGAIAGARKKVS